MIIAYIYIYLLLVIRLYTNCPAKNLHLYWISHPAMYDDTSGSPASGLKWAL